MRQGCIGLVVGVALTLSCGAEPLFLSVDPDDTFPVRAQERPLGAGPERPRIVLDLDGNERLDDLGPRGSGADGVLLMGTVSAEERPLWEILRGYDLDRDGVVDTDDPAHGQLFLWVDADGDLVPEAAEIQDLLEAGIQEIQLPEDPRAPSAAYRTASGVTRLAGIEVF